MTETNISILHKDKEAQKSLMATQTTVALFGIFIIIFLVLVWLVFIKQNLWLDHRMAAFAHTLISAFTTNVFLWFTYFGSQHFLVPAYLILSGSFLLKKKLRKYSWRILVTGITGTLMMFGLKYLFGRERPLEPLLEPALGYSFPSGHSFSSLLFFGMLIFIIIHAVKNNWLKYISISLLLMFTLMIGFSRIYLNVHFATDVIAGFSLAICWLLLSDWLLFKQLHFFTTQRQ